MKKNMIIAAAIIASSMGVAGIGVANAGAENNDGHAAETQGLMSAKLTATDAIKAVEAQQPGKVGEVQFNAENGVSIYEVSVISSDGAEHNFNVDASNGTVTKVVANGDDDGDQGDDENGDEADGPENN